MNLHPRTWTLRARLTTTFAALFTLAGVIVLGVSYAVVSATLTGPGPGQRVPRSQSTNQDRTDPEAFAEATRLVAEEWDSQRSATLTSLLVQSGIALLLTMALATLIGWLLAGRTLRRLRLVTETAKRVTDTSLHERIGLEGGSDEVQELADSVDAMLARLDRSFDSQARFVANASHELRTPLAVERTLLEVEIAEPDASEDLKRIGGQLLRINERHELMLEDLLTLAQSDQPLAQMEEHDLSDFVTYALSVTPHENLEVVTELEPAAVVCAPGLIDRLVVNLIANAVRHNCADGWIRISTRADLDKVTLTISNSGTAIPPHDVPDLLLPFSRGRDRTGPGHGLGLSIVATIVQRHNGQWHFVPRGDGGADVSVELPKKQPRISVASRSAD